MSTSAFIVSLLTCAFRRALEWHARDAAETVANNGIAAEVDLVMDDLQTFAK